MPDITLKVERPRVEERLARYRAVIGSDYEGYRNHVYRAITILDFGRIMNWPYPEPSEAVALNDNEKFGWGLAPDALRGAIHWHHKQLRREVRTIAIMANWEKQRVLWKRLVKRIILIHSPTSN